MNISSIRDTLGAMPDEAAAPSVVVYCGTGMRSGAMAIQLSAALGLPVGSLCGGIINYYNQGGTVHSPEQGRAVQSLHPGKPENKALIGPRPNGFKFP